MSWSEQDLAHIRAALHEAQKAEAQGEIPVGAVVVAGGNVIGRGHNRSIADHDPSGHAEIVALRAAARRQHNYRLDGATLFVTLEPCVMCAGAIAAARISRVVFGAYDPKAGALGGALDLSENSVLGHRFEINGGVLADECGARLSAFFTARR